MTEEQNPEVVEDDHDLLTFSESDVRLTEEIARVETELSACADATLREQLEGRRTALRGAVDRNSRHADTRPGE
ncbi:MAG: hypothetical protein ACJ72O_12735 [Marmoricola sp.]